MRHGAEVAVAAVGVADDDAVALHHGLAEYVAAVAADLLDNGCGLMSRHVRGGSRRYEVALPVVDIGAAEGCGVDAREDAPVVEVGEGDALQLHRGENVCHYCGEAVAHLGPPYLEAASGTG